MPLPDIAGESRFGVDLVLVHIDLLAKDLFHRIDHARMGTEQPERLVVEMGGKGGARRAALLPPYLRAVGVVDALRLAGQQLHFLLAEQLRQKQPALVVEIVDLLLGQLHKVPPRIFGAKPVVLFERKTSTAARGLPTRAGTTRGVGEILGAPRFFPLRGTKFLRIRVAPRYAPAGTTGGSS